MFRALFTILPLALHLLALGAYGAQPVPGAKHPVAQLVEWELTANAEISRTDLEQMAEVILQRAESQALPPDLLRTLNLPDFRLAGEEQKKALLSALPEEMLKKIALIPVPIEYFELLEADLLSLPHHIQHELPIPGQAEARKMAHFTRDGKKYVRWFIHPMADAKRTKIAKIFETRLSKILSRKQSSIKFHFTSSRSVILFDGSYAEAVSAKLSLPKATGPFKDKAINLKSFEAWAKHNAYLADTLPKSTTESLRFQQEPLGLGVGDEISEDAQLFRNLDQLAKEKRYLLPAFSVLNEETGRAIAALNGSSDPLAFWEEHLLKPFARGQAELRANTGAEHTSPHSQNLLVELDQNMKPTGKIVMRDADFYIDAAVFKKLNRVVADDSGLTKGGTQMPTFSLRNGLHTLPSWMTETDHRNWVKKYFETFRERFAAVTQIPADLVGTPLLRRWLPDEGYTITKYAGWAVGGTQNFHAMDLAAYPEFIERYQNWVSAKAPDRPVTAPLPQPQRKITPDCSRAFERFSF